MDFTILKEEKEEIELELAELTVAEILRVYLNKDSDVVFAAWKRLHPTDKPILKVKTKGKVAKKAVVEAIGQIEKDLDKVLNDFKKLK